MRVDITIAKQTTGIALHILSFTIVTYAMYEYRNIENKVLAYHIIYTSIGTSIIFLIGLLIMRDIFSKEIKRKINIFYGIVFLLYTSLIYIVILEYIQNHLDYFRLGS